jgi:hypothetical protein
LHYNDDDEPPPLVKRHDEDSSDDEDDDDEPPPLGKSRAEDTSDDEDDDPLLTSKSQVKSKSKRLSLRQRALLSSAHLMGHDVSNTASVYHAMNFLLLPIVSDSRASVSVTLHVHDFRGLFPKYPTKLLDGSSSGMEVLGMGQVTWEIQYFYGVKSKITTMVYCVPKANIRLFSPKVYFDEKNDGSYHMTKDMTTLTLGDGTHMVFHNQSGNKLPMMLTSRHFNNLTTTVGLTLENTTMLADITVADEVNRNLTAAKKELLLWHWKIGHADI